MEISKKYKSILLVSSLLILIVVPFVSFAQELNYTLLQPLPIGENQTDVGTTTSSQYFSGVITLIIAFSLILAVIRIIYGGIKYMSTDAFQGKNEAKDTIRNALTGFVLVAAAWLIVTLINPDITNLNLQLKKVDTSGSLTIDGVSIIQPEIAVKDYFEGCSDCNILGASIPHKDVSLNGCAKTNPENDAPVGACIVNRALRDKLVNLAVQISKFSSDDPGIKSWFKIFDPLGLFSKSPPFTNNDWWVTEMYPPSVPHASACHKYGPTGGTCVDANFKSHVEVTPVKVAIFLKSALEVNLNTIYEVRSLDRKNELLKNRELKNNFANRIVVTCNQEHFHISMRSYVPSDSNCK